MISSSQPSEAKTLRQPLRGASVTRSTRVMPAIFGRTSTHSNACLSPRPPVRRCRSTCSLTFVTRPALPPCAVRMENWSGAFVDITTSDIEGYVRKASQQLSQRIQYPPGYYLSWAGQFQYLQAAKERLKIVIPFTLLIIFVLLYMNTKSLVKTAIVLLAVPFSLIGAFWLLFILGYNMSVAVWVGLIALAGLDAETGVVMLLYLDHAWEKLKAEGRITSMRDLHDAVIEGAVGRVRPKIMTVCAIFFGLLPIMWSPAMQAGADVMKRIATPMIGGVVT